jgi:predicted lipid-binding transport protein (Tim44 family)
MHPSREDRQRAHPGVDLAVVDAARIAAFVVLGSLVVAGYVARVRRAQRAHQALLDQRQRLVDRRIDPYLEDRFLCELAKSLFMRVQAARDRGDRDTLVQLVSDGALAGIELCGVRLGGWTSRVQVQDKPKVSYAGARAGVSDRHDGAVFLIEARLREFETDEQGRERPRNSGERDVHEYWTLGAEGSDGPWKVIAIAPDANLDGGQRDLAAVASSMFRQVQAARDIDDVAELEGLVSDDLAGSIELFGEDSDGCTRHVEIVGGPPEIRYVGRAGDGFAFAINAHLRECEENAPGVKLDRGRGTYELRERWTLARGPDHDWKVIAIADAQ